MAEAPERQRALRFGAFELDVRSRELRKGPRRLRVADHSIQVLEALLEHPGEVVTRQELRRRLWPADTFVDFEHGLNTAVRRLRAALGDSADHPRFVETLPRSGYRFIAPVAVVPERFGADSESPSGKGARPQVDVRPASADHSHDRLHPSDDARGRPGHRLRPASIGIGAGLALAAILLVSVTALPPDASEPRAFRQLRLTFDDGLQAEPSLSSDGSAVAYTTDRSGNFDIWTQPVAGGNPVRVTTDPAHDWQPDWAPDDQHLVFRSERGGGGLFVAPVTGGYERRIADFGYRPTWSPDGSHVLFRSSLLWGGARSALFVTGLDGEPARRLDLTALVPGEKIGAFGWVPDGRSVGLLSGEGPDFALTFVTVGHGDGTVRRWGVSDSLQQEIRRQQLSVARGERFSWDAAGHTLYFIGVVDGASSIWAVAADAARHRLVAGPFRISSTAAAGNVSVSRTGRRLAFDDANRNARIWRYPLDATGRAAESKGRPLTAAAMHAFGPALSPCGTQVLFMQLHPAGSRHGETVVRSLAGTTSRIVRTHTVQRGVMTGLPFRWAPDGFRVAYQDVQPAPATTAAGLPPLPSVSGAPQRERAVGQTRLLDLRSGRDVALTGARVGRGGPASWVPDGRFVALGGSDASDPSRHAIVLLPVAAAPDADRAAVVVTASTEHRLFQPNVSPDGRWIAFVAAPTAAPHRTRIMVVPSSGGSSSHWRAVSDGPWDDKPRWSFDGRLLYFTSDRAGFNVWAVPFDTATGSTGPGPFPVTQFSGPGTQILQDLHLMEIDVGGGQLVVPIVTPQGSIWMLDGATPPRPAQLASTMR